jgi:hypothetical protein
VNGWRNYPTWAVNLWLGEVGSLDGAILAAADMERDANALRSYIEDNVMHPMGSEVYEPASLLADLLGWALEQVDWTELRDHYDPRAYAREIGAEHGRNAASWFFDGNTPRQTYARVLRGLEDGDPEVMDTIPHADLSGEWADRLTGPELVRDALSYVGWSGDDEDTDWFSDICDAYELAFDTAAHDEIARMARVQVAP